MMSIAGYSPLEKLYYGLQVEIYRCLRLSDQQKVIFKMPRNPTLPKNVSASLQHEYNLLKRLKLPGVVQAQELIRTPLCPILVLENIEGQTLESYLQNKPLPLEAAFNVMLQLVKIISSLHQENIIHKDIKPSNIIINPVGLTIKLLDLSISSEFSEENNESVMPNLLEGTPAYISPEQTGRMNRPIDYRTDFYSLGVTFFEILTGELPFQGDDVLSLIHAHLTKTPPSITSLNPVVPEMLAQVVAKLLSKKPEDRYKSCIGIKADLNECVRQWEQKQAISYFPLAQYDSYDRLQISHILYGREYEIERLLNAFDRVSHGSSELFVVAGYSGIGKSSLVKEINKPITKKKGYFIQGKYDQVQRSVPYSAISEAFKKLVKQILTENEEIFLEYKEKIQKALGNMAQVMIDIVPNLEQIIGPQPAVPTLSNPTEIQNRLIVAFERFIQIFASQKTPLALFLDDLQWADTSSLKLLEHLLNNSDIRYLLVIAAYRDNEVKEFHPMRIMEDNLQKAGHSIEKLKLEPLDKNDIEKLLMDTLHVVEHSISSLAKLVAEKTEGNPYFINEFLKSIYNKKILYYSHETNQWSWDISEIKKLSATSNITDLLKEKIEELSYKAQSILKFASCIGHVFDAKTLATISELSIKELVEGLQEITQYKLIIPLNKNHRFYYNIEENDLIELLKSENLLYQFIHDQVQQTAYQMIPEEHRKIVHYDMACLLFQNNSLDDWEESSELFNLLHHFNNGISLINQELRPAIAKLNYVAGCRAKSSAAYSLAANYIENSINLINKEELWKTDYRFAFNLFRDHAEANYLIGQFELVDKVLQYLLENANNVIDKANIYNIKVTICLNSSRYTEGINTALAALKLLGFEVSENPSRLPVIKELLKIKWQEFKWWWNNKKVSDIDLPVIHDPKLYEMSKTLYLLQFMTYQAKPNLAAVMLLKLVSFHFEKGCAPYISDAPLVYNYIQITEFNRFDKIKDFIELSKRCEPKLAYDPLAVGKNRLLMGIFISHWFQHARHNLDYLNEAYNKALEIGNLIFAEYSLTIKTVACHSIGMPLEEVLEEIERAVSFSRQLPKSNFYNALLLHSYLIRYLQNDKTLNFFDIENQLQKVLSGEDKSAGGSCYQLCCETYYHLGKYERALEIAENAYQFRPYLKGMIVDVEMLFYFALCISKCYKNYSADIKKHYKKILLKIQQQMQIWANHCPDNFLHKNLILLAEIASLNGKPEEAYRRYEDAKEKAKEQEYMHMVALAHELAGNLYIEQKNYLLGKENLEQARYHYNNWGAFMKADLIARQLAKLNG